MRSDTVSRVVFAALVFLISTAVYANALRNGYALDDVHIVQNNPFVHGLDNLRAILLGSYWPGLAELYRPITLLSFAVEWAIWGDRPAVFHATNVLLHAAVTVTAMLLVLRLGAPLMAAAAGALLFGVHPVHVEAVANLVGRAELLAALLLLLAIHLHLTRSIRLLVRAIGVAICYALALGAKEMAATLPALLLLFDALGVQRSGLPLRQRLKEHLVLLPLLTGVLGGFLLLRAHVLGEALGSAVAPYLSGLSTADRIATSARLWPQYLRLLFWPRDLSSEWGPAAINTVSWQDAAAWLGVATILLLGGIVVAAWRRLPLAALAILWFALAVLPVSHLFFPTGVMLAERNLYIPSIALLPLVAAAARLSVQTRVAYRRLAAVAVCMLVVLGTVHTWQRTPVWASTGTVNEALIRSYPETARAQWMIGSMYASYGLVDYAEPYYQRAYELMDGNALQFNLQFARLLLELNRAAEARPLLERLVSTPEHRSEAYPLLAQSFLQEQDYGAAWRAVDDGRRFVEHPSANSTRLAHFAALALDGLGDRDAALLERQASLEQDSLTYPYWLHLARLSELAGNPQQASAARERAIALASPRVRNELARLPQLPLDTWLMWGWSAPPPPSEPRQARHELTPQRQAQ